MQLKASGLSLASSARASWAVEADNGTTVDMLLKDDYWVHVHQKFNRGALPDRIEVYTPDNSLYAEIMVIGKLSLGGFSYRLIHEAKSDAVANGIEIDDGLFRIEFAGEDGWRVTKRQGKGYSVKVTNLVDPDAGRKWIIEHKKALKAA